MSIRLPLEDLVGKAGVSFTMELEGDVFRLDFRYNDRDGRYYMSVFDEDDEPIVTGQKIILGMPLLPRVVDRRRPLGEFLAVDVGARAEPTLGTLGLGVDLIFIPYTEAIG